MVSFVPSPFSRDRYLCALLMTAAVIVISLPVGSRAAGPASKKSPKPAKTVLVTVGKSEITATDLERMVKSRKVPDNLRATEESKFLEQLIESKLIQQYLAARNTTAPKDEVDAQVKKIKELASKKKGSPEQALADMGYTAESLREEIALPIAWSIHVSRTVTQKRLQEYFAEHREEFNGTQVRASHIVIRTPAGTSAEKIQKIERQLANLREQIINKETTFEDAAREYSEGPSKDQGGDIGLFPRHGKMPEELAAAAFAMPIGELSQPFRSKFGVHLCFVTERKEGTFSLEDVRDEVLSQLGKQLWNEALVEQRKISKIERHAGAPGQGS